MQIREVKTALQRYQSNDGQYYDIITNKEKL